MNDKPTCTLLQPRFAAWSELQQIGELLQNRAFNRCFWRKP